MGGEHPTVGKAKGQLSPGVTLCFMVPVVVSSASHGASVAGGDPVGTTAPQTTAWPCPVAWPRVHMGDMERTSPPSHSMLTSGCCIPSLTLSGAPILAVVGNGASLGSVHTWLLQVPTFGRLFVLVTFHRRARNTSAELSTASASALTAFSLSSQGHRPGPFGSTLEYPGTLGSQIVGRDCAPQRENRVMGPQSCSLVLSETPDPPFPTREVCPAPNPPSPTSNRTRARCSVAFLL